MKILAIETSCDDTAIAILEDNIVLSSTIYSQIKEHKLTGGVVPEIASRLHSDKIFSLITYTLNDSNLELSQIDAIAVTGGPGLIGTLQVGLIVAKTLSMLLNIPYYKINHLEGHIYSPFISKEREKIPKKALFLIVSGGHTIIGFKDGYNIKYLGETRDDAIGETYDKVAKILNLGYPGGPIIDKKLQNVNHKNYYLLPKVNLSGYDFSYSGIKTWVFNQSIKENIDIEKLLYSFQNSAIDQLIKKIYQATKEYDIKNLIICGGVSANSYLRKKINYHFSKKIEIFIPKLLYTGDNAAMIGYTYYVKNKILKPSKYDEDSLPNWKVGING